MSTNQIATEEELQEWLDEQDAQAQLDRKEQARLNKLARRPFEHMKHDFKVQLYAKAIGAKP